MSDQGIGGIVEQCDPGIRDVVQALRGAGIETTDSGDGVSKPEAERALDVEHVFAVCDPGLSFVRALEVRMIIEEVRPGEAWTVTGEKSHCVEVRTGSCRQTFSEGGLISATRDAVREE